MKPDHTAYARRGGILVSRCRRRMSSLGPLCALGLFASVVLLLVPSSALAAQAHNFLETFGTANKPSFTEAQGMAVDQSSGDLLVIDAGNHNLGEGTISRFNPDGTPAKFSALAGNVIDGHPGEADKTPEGGLEFNFFSEVQVAVDNSGGATDGNIYVAEAAQRLIDVFAKDGSYLGQLTGSSEGPFNEPCGVAVDPSGNVYVGDYAFSKGHVRKFEPTANPPVDADSTANFEFEHVCTLAAGAGPTAGFIFPTHIFGSVAKLDSASGEETYEVSSGESKAVTVDSATGHVYTASANEVKEYDASGPAGATLLSRIPPGGEEVTGIAVDKASGHVYVARKGNTQIEVWGPPVTLPDALTEAATVAKGSATLHGTVNVAGGPPATCVFQYVEAHAKGFEGASTAPCSPAGPFTGSASEPVEAQISGLGEAGYRFRLLATNANGSNDGGTLSFSTFEELGLPDGRAYEMVSPSQKAGEVIPGDPGPNLGRPCFECLPGVNAETMPMQSAPDGESVLYLGQPFSGGLAAGLNQYLAKRAAGGWATQSFSSPTTTGQYKASSADLSHSVLYQVTPALSPQAPTRGDKSFVNLYLRAEDGSLQPLISEEPPHRDPGDPSADNAFRVTYTGANPGSASAPDFSHLTFEANDALTEAVPGIAPKAPEAQAGSRCGLTSCNLYEWEGGQLRLVNVLPGNTKAASNSVIGSGYLLAQGGHYVPTEAPGVDHAISADGSRIFWSDGETGQVYVRIDGKETQKIEDPGKYLVASGDGLKVLLSDGCLYDLEAKACEDLSKGQGGFQGYLGAAEDLSRVYFVDTAALTGGEENANGEHAQAGKFNLYVWSEGSTDFIGTFLNGDNGFGFNSSYGDWHASGANRTAQTSPDGDYLAFMSQAALTGYDNKSATGGCEPIGCSEVYEYAARSGTLICASCNPTGAPPIGDSNLSLLQSHNVPFRQPGNLSSGGRLFFVSSDTLSPRDINGEIQDVYEWEPNGIGSCTRPAGCVFLISSGQSPVDSMFLDSTPSGSDAFFITREQMLLGDKDEQLDVYDARVGGGIAENPAPPCLGEACKGPISSAPAQQSAGSASFAGPGNEKPKKKHKHKKKRKHKKHKRAAKHNRGGQK